MNFAVSVCNNARKSLISEPNSCIPSMCKRSTDVFKIALDVLSVSGVLTGKSIAAFDNLESTFCRLANAIGCGGAARLIPSVDVTEAQFINAKNR